MANTCTICKHERRAEIESALVRRASLRDIAGQFSIAKSSVSRHQSCMAEMLEEARQARLIQSAINVESEMIFCRDKVKPLVAACFDWLTDPADSSKLYLGPRAEDIEVAYTVDADEKKTRKKARLSELLHRLEEGLKISVEWSESKIADPRDLLVKASAALGAHMKTYHGIKQQAEMEQLKQQVEEIKAMLTVSQGIKP